MADGEKTLALQELQSVLQGKQDPRRCLEVTYYAQIFDGNKNSLGKSNAETEHGDVWLANLFNK